MDSFVESRTRKGLSVGIQALGNGKNANSAFIEFNNLGISVVKYKYEVQEAEHTDNPEGFIMFAGNGVPISELKASLSRAADNS